MSDVVIKVENLGKKYRIRHQQRERYTALRDVIARTAATPLRWLRAQSAKREAHNGNGSGHSDTLPLPLTPLHFGPDASPLPLTALPSSKNGSPLPLSSSHSGPNPLPLPLSPLPSQEDFWALRDVNFEVKQGEVVGIIGRNGAGKSTLLKILSRITEPTEGRVRIKGRVASLLEVGTGFHPELTGRENIFVNGAILGMSRQDIRKRFDEIVAFAEIDKFLDTPVKRYSSGMYVRLAFAVAAHLEPEILVVDEVLAVGDAAFQNKCVGKMADVAHSGRTVLFVSHNMAAVRQLCGRAIHLKQGAIANIGDTEEIIRSYLREALPEVMSSEVMFDVDPAKDFQMLKVRLVSSDGEPRDSFHCDEPIIVELKSISRRPIGDLYGYFAVIHTDGIGTTVLVSDSRDVKPNAFDKFPSGLHRHHIIIPPRVLGAGEYRIAISFASTYHEAFLVDAPGRELVRFGLSDLVTTRGNNRGGYISALLAWRSPVQSANCHSVPMFD